MLLPFTYIPAPSWVALFLTKLDAEISVLVPPRKIPPPLTAWFSVKLEQASIEVLSPLIYIPPPSWVALFLSKLEAEIKV